MLHLKALLLACFAMLSLAAESDPVFRIKVQMSGRTGDASFSSSLELGYAPCAIWTGGSGGWKGTPAEFLTETGGLAAIRPGMSLPFFAMTHSGSAQGSDGSSASVSTSGRGFAHWTERNGDSESVKDNDPSDQPDRHQSARFYRTATGARIADFDLGLVSAGGGSYIGCIIPSGMELDGSQVAKFCAFEITNDELANWHQLNKTKSQTFKDANGTVTVTATLFVELEDPGEVTLEPQRFEQWIPEGNEKASAKPGNSLTVKARVHPTGQPDKKLDRKVTITFRLEHVSTEPGICLNFPKNSPGDEKDLRILPDENPDLEPLSETEAKTRKPVERAEVVISSFDFGAHGALRVIAEDDRGRKLKVNYKGRELATLALPKDETGGHIADAWREQEGAVGLLATWDEAMIPGQDAKGDGLTLYQKYRGMLVLENGAPVYRRLKAKEKVHFVLDPEGVFDAERWRLATGIKVFKMLDSILENRRVDFNSSGAPGNGGGGKRATRIEVMKGVVEGEGLPGDDGNITAEYEPRQYAYTAGMTPGTNTRLRIFPDRMRDMLSRVKAAMRKELSNPQNLEDLQHAIYLLSLGSKESLLQQLDEVDLAARTQALVALTAIHEMGHVCSLRGHLNAAGEEDDCYGVGSCPMHYLDWRERRHFLLTGTLTGEGRFCTSDNYECFMALDVKR